MGSPGRLTGRPGALPTCAEKILALLEEAQDRLRQCVGLGQHGRAGLNQDVILRVRRAFLRHIHVFDAAVGRRDVVVQYAQLILSGGQAGDIRADAGAIGRDLNDSGFDGGERGGGAGSGRDAGRSGGGVGGDAQINSGHRKGAAISVDGDVEVRAVEEAGAVEVFGGQVVDVCAKSAELFLIQRAIRI